ncbi:MAG: diacylglycerol kinase family protein [Gemmatimonadota bacterium]|nr:diacylglycerol kinase family protein [Gemmatimonadota bacterium]MDH4349950.1 diacylglycerol kinase family protein [Gemmatimonadota bacterium]MDH5196876.1 diacylglycerol kinase family protein [Gemmatimonadota bacterium]
MLAIVNPTAGGGKGLARWQRVAPKLARRLGMFTAVFPRDADDAREVVRRAVLDGECDLIAAGGDGTVNLVVATVLQHTSTADRESVRLGAVGLGSSNDFHKPVRPETVLERVPVRVAFHQTVRHDVGRLRYRTLAGEWQCCCWILNASVGITAEGNRCYNDDPMVTRVKRVHPDLGMVWAALIALGRGAPRTMTVATDGGPEHQARVTNLGIVKNPHFTGVLRYDSAYDPGSGYFTAHLLGDVSGRDRLRAFIGLHRGHFTGLPGTATWRARQLRIRAEEAFAVEGDGEIIMTTDAEFTLEPRALAVCA